MKVDNLLGLMFAVPFFSVLIMFGVAIAYDYSNDDSEDGIK